MSKYLTTKKQTYRLLFVTAFILAIPLVAMLFTKEVDWHIGDFIIGGLLLLSFGYLYEVFTKNLNGVKKGICGALIFILFTSIWIVLAIDLM